MLRLMVLGAALAVAGGAQAHSPYLLPNGFDLSGRDHVTLQASFTEHPFIPDVVMKSEHFHVTDPTGATRPLTPSYFRDLTVLEAPVEGQGTWRFSSGARAGRMSKVIRKGEDWVFLEPGKPVPAGVVPADMQSITTAETYVSRGAPNQVALAPLGRGLELHPLTHPNSISVDQEARFEALLDGRPLPGQKILLVRADADADGDKPQEIVADAAGRFALKAGRPGAYLAMTRYRIAPVDGQPGRSLTYALTFEAVR
ncbi:DUF4198 domain-containing protein [Phenylobacterium sp. LjRoot225]|uniref:DUF4198 domain-containing protein n=1 Tax=Phenylobacterium sp. LjRoot225 TaxID=3342285 RepID=UPI003ECC3BEF